jgi:hypothetical protein
MNATDVLQTEPAAMQSGSAAGDNAPHARARSSHMTIRHLGMVPSIHPDAYVAPTAVVSGQVSIGAGSCIMHGAILAAEGGPGPARRRLRDHGERGAARRPAAPVAHR